MSDYRNLFPGFSSLPSRTPVLSSTQEISLRDEIADILRGTKGGVPKGQYFLLRRMVRDDAGDMIQCPCVDSITREPDIDYICPYCRGEGHQWAEELVIGYKAVLSALSTSRAFDIEKLAPGFLNLPAIVFYFEYFVEPKKEDKIIIIELGLDGVPVTPYNRLVSHEINLLIDYRSDNGRVEYWACYCSTEGIKTKAGLP